MRRGGNVLVVVAVSLLAACSGSDDSTASPTTEAPPATPAPTEVTTESPTTPPPTDPPPPTDAPTTTTDPATTLAAEVEADLLEALALARVAESDPFDAAAEAAALDRRLGVIRGNLQQKLADFRGSNYAIRANDSVPASVEVELDAVLVPPSDDVAQVQICEVDSWVTVEIGAGPSGGDAVVDPSVIAARSTVFLRLDEGQWKLEGGREIERWEGGTECPA